MREISVRLCDNLQNGGAAATSLSAHDGGVGW
jgi:hypothetical protein